MSDDPRAAKRLILLAVALILGARLAFLFLTPPIAEVPHTVWRKPLLGESYQATEYEKRVDYGQLLMTALGWIVGGATIAGAAILLITLNEHSRSRTGSNALKGGTIEEIGNTPPSPPAA